MKRSKRILSLLLALVMCLSLVPTTALAQTRDFKVVAIGDSTSNGFGLADYGVHARYDYTTSHSHWLSPEEQYLCSLGFLDTGSDEAYPSRLARYIAAKHPEYRVSFTNLAISGIRNTEIRAIIDESFSGDSYTPLYDNRALYLLRQHMKIDDLHDYFVREIKDADVITLDACMNSFTTYLSARLSDCLSGNADLYAGDTLAATVGTVSPELQQILQTVEHKCKEQLSSVLPAGTATDVADTLIYCLGSCMTNFTAIVKLIYQLNPDVQLLVGSAYSPLHGQTVVAGKWKMDLSELLQTLVSSLNTYITKYDPNCLRYSYIALPDYVETHVDELARTDTVWDLSPTQLALIIDDFFSEGYATPLCTEARAEATEQGLDISDYTNVYPADVVDFFAYARDNGQPRNQVEAILLGKFESVINLLLIGAKNKLLELDVALNAISFSSYRDIMEMCDTPVEELTSAQKTTLSIFVLSRMEQGAGAHFSAAGCNTKYEAALRAYESSLPARAASFKTVRSAVKNALATCRKLACSLLGLLLNR